MFDHLITVGAAELADSKGALTLGPVVLYRAGARLSPLPSTPLVHTHIAPV